MQKLHFSIATSFKEIQTKYKGNAFTAHNSRHSEQRHYPNGWDGSIAKSTNYSIFQARHCCHWLGVCLCAQNHVATLQLELWISHKISFRSSALSSILRELAVHLCCFLLVCVTWAVQVIYQESVSLADLDFFCRAACQILNFCLRVPLDRALLSCSNLV